MVVVVVCVNLACNVDETLNMLYLLVYTVTCVLMSYFADMDLFH